MMRTMMLMLGGLAACHAAESRPPIGLEPMPGESEEASFEAASPAIELPVAIVEPTADLGAPMGLPIPTDAGPAEGDAAEGGLAPAAAVYSLRSGETLDHFARWSGIPVEELATSSALPLMGPHDVGTEVVIVADDDLRATIDLAREAHHASRVDRYLDSRGGLVDHTTYEVRTGDTAWKVARDHGRLPVWIVSGMNPSIDVDALVPGQVLTLPVTADMAHAVVEVETSSRSEAP